MRILLVEDDFGIAKFIKQGLQENGFAIDVVADGADGLAYAEAAEYDIIILDVMLPSMTGVQILRRLRTQRNTTPVLLLTALDGIDERVAGLDAGADDYLVKPFAFPELMARLRALLRRPPLQVENILQIADLQMDTKLRIVKRGMRKVILSPKEYSVLEYMLRHPKQVLTRTQIGEHVWNFDFFNESNVVDVYVGYLRRKIDKGEDLKLIHTVRGVGYRLSEEAL